MQPSGVQMLKGFFNQMGEEEVNVSDDVLRLGLRVCFTQ